METPQSASTNSRQSDVLGSSFLRFQHTIHRVSRLVNLTKGLSERPESRILIEMIADDIYRGAVVLAHAGLEDFLRNVARCQLEQYSAEMLKDIPYVGSKRNPDKKFSLLELAQFKGKTVDEVVSESVEEYLETKSFSNTTQVAGWLQRFKVEVDVEFYSPFVAELMERRHRIAHAADYAEGDRAPKWTDSDHLNMAMWVCALESLAMEIWVHLQPISTEGEGQDKIQAELRHYKTALLDMAEARKARQEGKSQ